MKCPSCGQPITDWDTRCLLCGAELSVPAPEKPASLFEEEQSVPKEDASEEEIPEEELPEEDVPEDASEEEIPVEELPEEDVPEEELPEEDAPEKALTDKPKKKKSVATIVLAAVAGVLLILVGCLTITITTLSSTGQMPGFVTAIQDFFRGDPSDDVAAVLRDADGNKVLEITNSQLNIYYWGEFFAYVQYYGVPFDLSQPLSEQAYSDTQSWQDYFLESAYATIRQYAALKAQGEAAGYTLPADYQTEYDTTIATLADYAVQSGFTNSDGTGNILAYLQDSYGSTVTEEAFRQYLLDYYYASGYSEEIYNAQTFTDQEYGEYYDQNSDLYLNYYNMTKSDVPDINIRHILIMPQTPETGEEATEEETAAAEAEALEAAAAEAQRIYQLWLDGEATEDSFAALAQEYSQDGSATSGGLIENVYPGQMVAEFNDWCFDPDRKIGDTGIVQTQYGFHIMFFSGVTDHFTWKDAVDSDLRYARTMEQVDALTQGYTVEPAKGMLLTLPTAVTDMQASGAAG